MRRVHLVSGTTSGIGLAIWERLQAEGDRVIPIYKDSGGTGFDASKQILHADFNKPHLIREAIKSINVEIDSFINCAGIAIGKPIWDTSEEEIDTVLRVNLVSPMIAIGALREKFSKNSCVVLFSSISAQRGGWDDTYIASKGAINSIVKSLALKLAPTTRVIGIAPGVTADTRMTRERKANDLENVRCGTPLQKLASSEELAELTVALLGSAGSHMTGSVVDVNGGAYLR